MLTGDGCIRPRGPMDVFPLSLSGNASAMLLLLGVPPLLCLGPIQIENRSFWLSDRMTFPTSPKLQPRLQAAHYVATIAANHGRARTSRLL